MKTLLICILLQLVLFIPFYLIWRNDCKEIGKENLAVSLTERFYGLDILLSNLVNWIFSLNHIVDVNKIIIMNARKMIEELKETIKAKEDKIRLLMKASGRNPDHDIKEAFRTK